MQPDARTARFSSTSFTCAQLFAFFGRSSTLLALHLLLLLGVFLFQLGCLLLVPLFHLLFLGVTCVLLRQTLVFLFLLLLQLLVLLILLLDQLVLLLLVFLVQLGISGIRSSRPFVWLNL